MDRQKRSLATHTEEPFTGRLVPPSCQTSANRPFSFDTLRNALTGRGIPPKLVSFCGASFTNQGPVPQSLASSPLTKAAGPLNISRMAYGRQGHGRPTCHGRQALVSLDSQPPGWNPSITPRTAGAAWEVANEVV